MILSTGSIRNPLQSLDYILPIEKDSLTVDTIHYSLILAPIVALYHILSDKESLAVDIIQNLAYLQKTL